VLTGVQATEAAVKAASDKGHLARARYVHFATHGILGLDTGQPPALLLSLVGNDGQRDADGGVNDGLLRLDEVTRLKLNADLVVLSACETGKGRLHAGEGVTGLARAFLYAGSRGVVCSLWSVDDRETAAFMARLYGGLKDGQAAADALRAAKLAMIRAGKPPVYWAPFILIGE
jgi:CHAT domain-containing protein